VNSPENEVEFDPFENESGKKKSGRSSGGVAWLALLLGVVAIAFNGWQWWVEQSADPGEQGRQMAIDDLKSSQASLGRSLEALQGRLVSAEQQDNSGELNALRSDLASLQARLSESGVNAAGDHALLQAIQVTLSDLAQRIGDAETNVAALAVRSDTPGKKMDLAEVDFLLRLAGERLALFGDARSAEHALGIADDQLEALDDPLYMPVRRSIGEARQMLRELPDTDLVAVSGQIAGLQRAIPSLPFPGETPVEVLVEDQQDAGLWQRVKNALAPLVKVRRRVNEDQELSLEDKDYLRQGLWLQLESARLALMRNDATAWDMSLDGARGSIEGRFDNRTGPVRSALENIVQLQSVELVRELPDISAPLRHLRLLREGRPDANTGQAGESQQPSESDDPAVVEPPEDEGDPNG
jgi:uroporphyrin-3 C-methyltransferase